MNKGLIKYLWALPLLGMLSGCSESAVDEGSQNSKYAIQFAVTASKQAGADGTKSRATIVDNDAVINQNFGLFAYSHADDWEAGTTIPSATPNFMNNQLVEHNNGSWAYNPLKFWTNDKISFFGYWPIMKNDPQVCTAKAEANAMPHVQFTQQMDAANMVDFITSHAINQTRDGGVVTLDFNHVLTRLNFKARLDEALATNSTTHIFVTGLKICGTDGYPDPKDATGNTIVKNSDSKFYKTATFVLGDGGADQKTHGQWVYAASGSITDAVAQDAALNAESILAFGKDNQTVEVEDDQKVKHTIYDQKAVKVSDDGNVTDLLMQTEETTPKQHYLFLIPPYDQGIQSANDVIVELDYDIVTGDKQLETYGVVTHKKQAVSLPNGTLAQGKAYNIIFTVGLNPVKVDVNVTDWDKNEITKYAPSVKATSNSAEDILKAWDAMNTTKAKDLTANYFVINVDNVPDKLLDLRTNVEAATRFAAFEMGDQVELLFSADADGKGVAFNENVLVPNGWIYESRVVNGVTRYIITKVANYITKVSGDATSANIETALEELNAAHTGDCHYYAVDIYKEAPANTGGVDLSSLDLDTKLASFDFTKDYLYIIFNTVGSNPPASYTTPQGWTLTATKTPGKYLLKKGSTTSKAVASVAIGDQGFTNGGTFEMNK